jgi:hypothetical protein
MKKMTKLVVKEISREQFLDESRPISDSIYQENYREWLHRKVKQ